MGARVGDDDDSIVSRRRSNTSIAAMMGLSRKGMNSIVMVLVSVTVDVVVKEILYALLGPTASTISTWFATSSLLISTSKIRRPLVV